MSRDNFRLTEAELRVIDMTAELWNAFLDLGDNQFSDREEMARDIHDIQQRIMARLARRLHPEKFR